MGGIGDLAMRRMPLLTSVARHVLPTVLPAAIESLKSKRLDDATCTSSQMGDGRGYGTSATNRRHSKANHSQLHLQTTKDDSTAKIPEKLLRNQITNHITAYSTTATNTTQTQ
jgi:hypothetical protein